MSVFDILDRPVLIQVTGGTETGTHNATTGVWEPPTQTGPTTIQGHISAYERFSRESMQSRGPAGVVEKGEMRLYTTSILKEGNIVTATQGAGFNSATISYRVMALVRAMRLINKLIPGEPIRFEYSLQEIPR